jgi:hypothetical protein
VLGKIVVTGCQADGSGAGEALASVEGSRKTSCHDQNRLLDHINIQNVWGREEFI